LSHSSFLPAKSSSSASTMVTTCHFASFQCV
jgi:hypothetical protein